VLDQDTITRLNRIKKECYPDRIIKPGPQVRLSIMAQLNDLLNNPRRKRRSLQSLKDKYQVKPRNEGLYQLKRKLTRGRFIKEWSLFPF